MCVLTQKEEMLRLYIYVKGDTISRYKESRSTESSLPLGAGETIHKTEIEDTVAGETGKGLGWD